ncbi:MAG TPA: ribonuclease HI family protein [Candidatus Levybacteria bacterium]|nr:ribonuclease HI family protein [Candidatus Levybacteria bacterium]
MVLTIFCDGGSRNNPGEAAYGFVIYDGGKVVFKKGEKIGIATNNVAEYTAIVKALIWVKENIPLCSDIHFFLDSALAVNQMNGVFKVKNEGLRSLYFTVKSLEKVMSIQTVYTAIPREKNKEADRMVNLALDGKI